MTLPAAAQTQPVSREKAAAALGGLDRIQKLRNIRLIGYGQYGYMFGGGNITGDPNAPMKFEAANALERVYDLEHGRYQQLERRNYLFPFAIPAGHDFHLNDWRLDGDVPYDVLPSGAAQRVYSWFEDAHSASMACTCAACGRSLTPSPRCGWRSIRAVKCHAEQPKPACRSSTSS